MEIEGKIIMDLGEQGGTSKAGNVWKKHEYVLETFGQYPHKVKFHVFGEQRIQSLNLVPGNNYVLSVDLDSREFNNRWYTDVSCFAARPAEMGAAGAPAAPNYGQAPAAQPAYGAPAAFQQPAAPAAPMMDPLGGDESDDLPF